MAKKVIGQNAEGVNAEIIEKKGDVSAEGTAAETTGADVKGINTELDAPDSVTLEETQEEIQEGAENVTAEDVKKVLNAIKNAATAVMPEEAKPDKGKDKIKKTAEQHLKNYPSSSVIYATEDGNYWLEKDASLAKNYAAENKLKLHEFKRK